MFSVIRYTLLLSCLGCAGASYAEAAPKQAPLAHFCKSVAVGPSETILKVPEEERQVAWMAEMTEMATKEAVPGWSGFVRKLAKQTPASRQAWLDKGVEKHGLGGVCQALKE